MGGLVAQVEGEAFFVYGAVVGEAISLQEPGAVAQPMVLGHAFDQNHFGAAHGAVLAFQVDDELVIFLRVLPRQKHEHAAAIGEAMADVVAGGRGFAFFRPGTGGQL